MSYDPFRTASLADLNPPPGHLGFPHLSTIVLVNARQTRPITWATGLELALIVMTLFMAVSYFDAVGVIGAALALVIGRAGANTYLLHPFLKALKKTG